MPGINFCRQEVIETNYKQHFHPLGLYILPEFRWTNMILYFVSVVILSKNQFFVHDALFLHIFHETFP